MATRWCDTLDGWVGRFRGWIREPTGPALLDAATFFDGRRAYGQLDVSPIDEAIGSARGQDTFLALLANEALRFTPAGGGVRPPARRRITSTSSAMDSRRSWGSHGCTPWRPAPGCTRRRSAWRSRQAGAISEEAASR